MLINENLFDYNDWEKYDSPNKSFKLRHSHARKWDNSSKGSETIQVRHSHARKFD
jgi:hypothetical protein